MKTNQGGAALGVDVIPTQFLLPDQGRHPGICIFLQTKTSTIFYSFCQTTCASVPPTILVFALDPDSPHLQPAWQSTADIGKLVTAKLDEFFESREYSCCLHLRADQSNHSTREVLLVLPRSRPPKAKIVSSRRRRLCPCLPKEEVISNIVGSFVTKLYTSSATVT